MGGGAWWAAIRGVAKSQTCVQSLGRRQEQNWGYRPGLLMIVGSNPHGRYAMEVSALA